MECLPNKLTLFNSEIYYKEENYLKVKTAVFKYITPPIVKGLVCWYIGMSACPYIPIFSHSHVLNSIMWLSYPLFYSFTSSISPAFCILILTQYKSSFSTCTILLIRSVTPAFSSLFLSLKSSFISKLLIRGVLCLILIWWLFLFLMPPIRFSASKRCACITAVILLLGEIMLSYSYYTKKKLVYIIIIALFSY